MIIWSTSRDSITYELSKEETRKYQEFKTKVNNIKASELKTKGEADPDTDYFSKRSKDLDYSVGISFVEGHMGITVYAVCESLGLKENITDYSTW